MSRRSVPLRLVITLAITTLLVVSVCGAIIHWAGREAVYLQQVNDLDHVALLARQSITTANANPPSDADRAKLKDLASILGVRITLIAGDGAIQMDTDATANLMDNHNSRPEVLRARQEGEGDIARRSHTLDEWSVYVARLLDPAKTDGVVVRVSQWRYPPPMLATSLLAVVGAATVSGLGAGLVLWLLLRNQWVVPLRTLRDAVRQISAGDWGRRAAPTGSEDVRALCAELNDMAAVAQRQSVELRQHQAHVKSLADTIPDAVLVTGGDDRVTLLNAPAAELLDVKPEQALGEKVASVVGDEALLELIDGTRRNSTPTTSENGKPRELRLSRNGQHLTLQAHAERTAGGGVMVVLRDVSTLSSTVQMKTDFVANASHELRTPMAAIKIAFETLRDVYAEDPAQAERCLTIIDGHMTRLEEMLTDLLDLSRVESAEMRPYLRDLLSSDVFTQIRATMGSVARKKGVELHLGLAETPIRFAGDERLLNLVLKNLVENSIKFTPSGGMVTVSITQKDGDGSDVEFSVSDTGAGIPAEHLDRVFERFYQVDPARSGSAGRGTGLGLAIVKHAVHAMGGRVEIRSTVGRGTVVMFNLPQDTATSDSAEPMPIES